MVNKWVNCVTLLEDQIRWGFPQSTAVKQHNLCDIQAPTQSPRYAAHDEGSYGGWSTLKCHMEARLNEAAHVFSQGPLL